MKNALKISLAVWLPVIIYGIAYLGLYLHAKSNESHFQNELTACEQRRDFAIAENENNTIHGIRNPEKTVPVCYQYKQGLGHAFLYLPVYKPYNN